MIETLDLALSLPFMQRAFVITTLVCLPMALLSPFLVLRGWSLMGDAVSHAVLPGVVLAYIAGIPLLIGAFFAGMACALTTGYVSDNSRVKEDTVMGVVFSAMFALGIVLYAAIETDVHLDHILFGNMLGVTRGDILVSGGIALAICAVILALRKDLVLHIFDPAHGRAMGLRMGLLHYLMLSMISLAVVGALSAVGLILAIALLISPAAIALLWSRRFGVVMILSAAISVVSGWLGVFLSLVFDSAPAPTIVMVLTILFICSFITSSVRNT